MQLCTENIRQNWNVNWQFDITSGRSGCHCIVLYSSVITNKIDSAITQMSSLPHPLRLHEISKTSSHTNTSSSCTCELYVLTFCETEGRANIWAVKCIPCIPVCTRAFRGFGPQQGSIACRFYNMFRLILRHLWFCVAFEIFGLDAATLHAFSASFAAFNLADEWHSVPSNRHVGQCKQRLPMLLDVTLWSREVGRRYICAGVWVLILPLEVWK